MTEKRILKKKYLLQRGTAAAACILHGMFFQITLQPAWDGGWGLGKNTGRCGMKNTTHYLPGKKDCTEKNIDLLCIGSITTGSVTAWRCFWQSL